jgi:hypothetical protein
MFLVLSTHNVLNVSLVRTMIHLTCLLEALPNVLTMSPIPLTTQRLHLSLLLPHLRVPERITMVWGRVKMLRAASKMVPLTTMTTSTFLSPPPGNGERFRSSTVPPQSCARHRRLPRRLPPMYCQTRQSLQSRLENKPDPLRLASFRARLRSP